MKFNHKEIKASETNLEKPDKSEKTVPRTKKNWKKRIILISVIVLILIVLSSVISYMQFESINPFASAVGIFRILATNTPYVVIQKNPKIMLAQPDDAWALLLSYMEQEGYNYIAEEKVGSMCIFEKKNQKAKILFHVNDYYSRWMWCE